MTTSPIHRTVHIAVLSAFLALAVFSFVAFGSDNAHAMTRQAANSSTTISVRIVTDQRFFVFRPSAITITSGTHVRITNTTTSELEIRTSQAFYNLFPGQGFTITPAQSTYVRVCGGYGGVMNITVG